MHKPIKDDRKTNANVKDLEIQLLVVDQTIKDYLERVEFYIEEPDSQYLSSLQQKRLNLKKQLLELQPSYNDFVLRLEKLEKVLIGSTEVVNTKNTHTPKYVGEINSKLNLLSTQLSGLQVDLKKERASRTNLITSLCKEDVTIYRTIYELSQNNKDVLIWIEEQISKNPEWGLKNNTTK
jgi:hypothetical protein